MGNDLCGGIPQEMEVKINHEELYEGRKNTVINVLTRKGVPSDKIAYNINQLPEKQKEGKNLSSIQNKIAKMQAHQKRHQKPMIITRDSSQQNRLPDPYYILSLDAIYIGEWVYDRQINDNVPGGIGRLYSSDEIIEGEVKSINLEDIPVSSNLASMITNNKEKAIFFSIVKSQKESLNINTSGIHKINVILEGQGRRFTHNSQFNGVFVNGQLEGKGQCRIKEGEDVYEYTGEFKKGKKSGKGIEKFKFTSYDGDFEEDQKNGKGTLTLLINGAYERQRIDQQAKIALQDKQKNPADKIEVVKKFLEKRETFQAALTQALVDFKWIPPELGKSMTKNQNFIIQHHRKTKFLQNYKGEFKNNQFYGQGIYTWFNGKTYNGEWKQGCMEGVGQFYWPNGSVYRGQYEKDLKHNNGEMIWSLYKRYRGTWAYGMKHGYGQVIEIEPNDKDNKCFVRVKGALFNKNQIDLNHVFFEERRQLIFDVTALDFEQKEMIAFIKDIKI